MRSFYRTAEVLIFLWIYPLIEFSENSLSWYILKQNWSAPFPLTQTFQPRSSLHFIANTLNLKLLKAQYQLKKEQHAPPSTNPRLMNALLISRPAKLWAFNIGHPCPSLAKGELLLLSQAQPTIEGSPPPTSPFLPSLQKQRTLPNSRRGGGLPLPPHRLFQISQIPPITHYPYLSAYERSVDFSTCETNRAFISQVWYFYFYVVHNAKPL